MDSLHFDVSALKESGALHHVETLQPSVLEDALEGVGRLSGPLDVELDLTYQAGRIGYRGKVHGQWELECVRCLAHPRADYTAPLEGTLEEGEAGKEVFEEVRQALILAAPTSYHCREDCKGLCPKCGADLNKGSCSCKPS
jgi:uncharacterized protein